VLLLSLLPLASTFIAVGAIPFAILALTSARSKSDILTLENTVLGPILLVVSGLFFLSNDGDYLRGWLWEMQDLHKTWPFLVLYWLVSFGIYVAVRPRLTPWRVWPDTMVVVIAVVFLLAPWYRLGYFSDLNTKVTAPAQLALAVILMSAISLGWRSPDRAQRIRARALALIVAVGLLSGVGILGPGLTRGPFVRIPKESSMQRVNELEPKALGAQLFATRTTIFWRWLARR
jgi:hypothetical protein